MNDKNQACNASRRNAIKKTVALTTAAICAPFVITPSRGIAKERGQPRIVIRTPGGKGHLAYTEILFKPFTQKTGIEMIGVSSKVEPTAEIKTMVDRKEYAWNMAILSHRAIHFLDQTYLEPHNLEKDLVVSKIMPQFMTPYSVGIDVFSTVLAYRTDAFKGRPTPKTWKDFWDVKNFPGRRGLRKIPFDTIEEALLADGALPSEVYPCDLNRAFRSLDRIKQHVSVWWQNAPEAEYLLKSGEVDLTPCFTISALSAIHAGKPVAFSWDQHIYGYDNWTILKGTPNADACREFIKFASDPERQARLAPYVAPTQPDALKYIDPKHIELLSIYPDNFKKGLPSNPLYWMNHQNAAIERFNQWMLS